MDKFLRKEMIQLNFILFLLIVLPCLLYGANCPTGWIFNTNDSKYYQLFCEKKSWNESKSTCEQEQAKLAQPKDFNANYFIGNEFGILAWIGCHRCDEDTCFLNNIYVPYTPYAPHEPDMKSDQQNTNHTTTALKANDFGILIRPDGRWADELKHNRYPYICERTAKSCAQLYKYGENKTGIYTIDPDGSGSFKVWCDMETDGGGWTVFQRRVDGSVNFYRGWSDYKAGFGDFNENFWLGLDKIHRLTTSRETALRVDLMDFDNTTAYAQYDTFSVAEESKDYELKIGGYKGDAGNSFILHNGMKFTTKDRDNDKASHNCAHDYDRFGAWWYNSCAYSNLNGVYLKQGKRSLIGISWYYWKNDYRSMKKVDMKLRPLAY